MSGASSSIVATATTTTSYRTVGDVPLAIIIDLLAAVDSPMLEMVAETHRAAQPHSALFWAQAWLENMWETTGHVITPADHNPVSLRPWEGDPTAAVTGDIIDWQTRRKVGTIRVPPGAVGAIRASDGSLMLRFATDAAGAREWRRRLFDDAGYKGGVYRSAITIEQMLAIYAPPGDVHPVTGVDNADIGYADAVRTMLATFARREADTATTTTPPASTTTTTTTTTTTGDSITMTYSTEIPGLPGGPLTTLVPVRTKLIPAWRTLNRPGIKAESPRRSVQHGNGNPTSSAAGEATYLANGADGRQASYHSAVDDREIWVMVPADEVTWQAADGAGPGNMNGYSCEMVEDAALWADPVRRAAVIRNTADFMGRVSARLGIATPQQHWDFNAGTADRHDCPNKLRYVTIGGRTAWAIYAEQWAASRADELRLMGGDGTGGQPPVTPTPPVGAYAKPMAIPELASITIDQHDSVEGVVTRDGGDDFIFVADVVEAVRPTRRLQFASAKAPSVGPDLVAGERFVVTWLVKAADGEWYYVTPWWTRVRRRDTKRIADAPIVPTVDVDAVPQAA